MVKCEFSIDELNLLREVVRDRIRHGINIPKTRMLIQIYDKIEKSIDD